MALLLAMFQKMRIQRELNEYTLKDAKISSKKSRIQKNIKRTTDRYTSLIAQIDAQAKMMASQAKVMFNQQIGLDMMNSNPYSGMSVFVMNMMQGSLVDQDIVLGKGTNNEKQVDNIDQATFEAMMAEYTQNGKFILAKDADGKEIANQYENNWTPEQVQAFGIAMNSARTQQQQAQMWAQQQSSNFDQNVSIWAEARKAELEAEQDMALEPLNYEDTMLDTEKAAIETRLEQLRAEKQSYDQLCSEEAKDSAPKFGLG